MDVSLVLWLMELADWVKSIREIQPLSFLFISLLFSLLYSLSFLLHCFFIEFLFLILQPNSLLWIPCSVAFLLPGPQPALQSCCLFLPWEVLIPAKLTTSPSTTSRIANLWSSRCWWTTASIIPHHCWLELLGVHQHLEDHRLATLGIREAQLPDGFVPWAL